jgi:hypothetical protein
MNWTLRQIDALRWAIVDETDRVHFQGTLRECEDWLDFQENQPPLKAPAEHSKAKPLPPGKPIAGFFPNLNSN